MGVFALVAIGIVLEKEIALPFYKTYRVVCAALCLGFIFKLGIDYSGERWPTISFSIALVANIGLFFTPLLDRPASRGEIMLFALPDAMIVLVTLILSYQVVDEQQRAKRYTMILGLVVASVACAALFALTLIGSGR
ncbi:hypothetical protein EAH87_04640 [Sphingomonas koreensis]|nr:hypothetical protein EAH87_04640 [Sphingomonas koreensis]